MSQQDVPERHDAEQGEDAARNRPDPARPVQFWCQAFAVPAGAVAAVAASLLAVGPGSLAAVTGEQALALGLALVLVVAGEVKPFIGSRLPDPGGVAWSATFAFAVLIYAGLLPATVVYALATLASGVLGRKAVWRWSFNLGQYVLSLAAAWAVLAANDRVGVLGEPWAPRSLADVGVVLLAAAAYFLVNETLVSLQLAALHGTSLRHELFGPMGFEIAVSGSQLALAPLVAVVMEVAPALTFLAIVPVAAVHVSAAASMLNQAAARGDDLTGLVNRKHLSDLVPDAVAESRRTGAPLALFLLDLDRFKEINDVLGHPAGDRVLQEVARRLSGALRHGDVVARLGGDEFAVLAPRVGGPAGAVDLAARIRRALEPPLDLGGRLIDLEASTGIALVPDHASDLATLFSRADVAMYHAKRLGTGVEVYRPALDSGAADRLGLLGALRRSIETGGIELDVQPKVAVADGRLLGVEALVRWRRDDGERVPPDAFVPLAEQSGLMSRLTAEVLDGALALCAGWTAQGHHVPIAVNVTLRDLLEPRFATDLAERLVRHGVAAPMLTLEITERVLVGDLGRVERTLAEAARLGVRISLDDFGTGWSSLVLLRRLPLSEIKLDRSFVSRIVDDPTDATIVAAVTGLSHRLGLEVVAEGVEDARTWQALADLGCEAAQGYHLARPMPPHELMRWTSRTTPGRPLPSPGAESARTSSLGT